MENILDEKIEESSSLTLKEIMLGIIRRPRSTFGKINTKSLTKYAILVIVIWGCLDQIDINILLYDDSFLGKMQNVGNALLYGVVFGLVVNFILSHTLSWMGRLLGGVSNAKAYFSVLAFSLVPGILGFFVKIALLLFGLRSGNGGGFAKLYTTPLDTFIFYLKTGVTLGLTMVWPTVLTIIGISVLQKFTFLKSLLNFVLGMIVFVIPVFLMIYLYFYVVDSGGIRG